jgi:hypothetical protein
MKKIEQVVKKWAAVDPLAGAEQKVIEMCDGACDSGIAELLESLFVDRQRLLAEVETLKQHPKPETDRNWEEYK